MKKAYRLLLILWDIGAIGGGIIAAIGIVRDICRAEHGFLLFAYSGLVIVMVALAILKLLTTIILDYADWRYDAVMPAKSTQ